MAKELVTLQEKLDSIIVKKSEEPKAEVCHVEPAVELVSKAANNGSMLNQEKQEETSGNGSSDDVSKGDHCVIESDQEQLLQAVEPEDKSKSEETSLALPDDTASPIVSEGYSQELSMASRDLEPSEFGSEAIMEQKNEASEGLREVCKVELMKMQEENNAPELKQAEEFPLEEDKNDSKTLGSSLEGADATCVDDNQENILYELPLNVIDNEPVESKEDVQAEKEDALAHGADEAEGLMAIQKALEISELAEMLTGVIDDDPVSSAEMENHGDEQGKVSECQSATETTLFEDKTSKEINKPQEVLEEKPMAETEEREKVGSEEEESLTAETPHFPQSEELQPPISLDEEGTQKILRDDECISAEMARPSEMPSEKIEKDDENLGVVITEGVKARPSEMPSEKIEKDDESLRVVITEGVKETQQMKVQAEEHREFVTEEKMNDKSYESSEITFTNDEVSAALHAQQEAEQEECDINGSRNDKGLIEENEKLRAMMEKLIEAGKQQLNVISNLNGRVKDLEKKLSRKSKLRTKRGRALTRGWGSSRIKCSNVSV